MKPVLLLVLLAAALPARAVDKPLRLSGGAKAEEALRRFVVADKRLKASLDAAAAREDAFLAESRDVGLRDAVSGNDRGSLFERLPGVKTPEGSACATLAACATPELSADASAPELIPDAIRRLVRPWMLLQQARGSELILSSVSGRGDALITMTLKNLDAAPLTLNVAPRPLGGFELWFDRSLVLASLYDRERVAALKTSARRP